MEKELDMALFRRTTQSVSLTEAGAYFAEVWAPLFRRFTESVDEARLSASRGSNALIISLVRDNPKSQLAQHLSETFEMYLRDHGIPPIQLNFRFYSMADQREALRKHLVDFNFSYGFDYDSLQNIDTRILARREVYAMLPKEHLLSDQEHISIRELENETFLVISSKESVSAHNVTLTALKRHLPRAKTEIVPNFQTMNFALERRNGIALGNRYLVNLDDYREVPILEFHNEGYDEIMAWRTDTMSVNKILFLNFIKECENAYR